MLMREITDDPLAIQNKAKAEALKQERKRLTVQQAQLRADKARQRANKANQKLAQARATPGSVLMMTWRPMCGAVRLTCCWKSAMRCVRSFIRSRSSR